MPKAKSTLLARAVKAKEEHEKASKHLRDAMVASERERAIGIARAKLETETSEDDWEVVTDVPAMRMALRLELAPLVVLFLPKGGSDLLLALGTDPRKWPTVRDLLHLGELIESHGLA